MPELEQWIYREARLADEGRYDAWEALWTDDGTYWIPANGDDSDPATSMSILHDNRSRIALRVAQLNSGKRHAQTPPSRLRRLVSNIEILEAVSETADEVVVGANFLIYESRTRGNTIWGGRYEYRLRQTDDGWRMAAKKVMLVDNDRPLPTLAFLI